MSVLDEVLKVKRVLEDLNDRIEKSTGQVGNKEAFSEPMETTITTEKISKCMDGIIQYMPNDTPNS